MGEAHSYRIAEEMGVCHQVVVVHRLDDFGKVRVRSPLELQNQSKVDYSNDVVKFGVSIGRSP